MRKEMNKKQILILACLLLACGCSAPRSFTTEGGEASRHEGVQNAPRLERTETITQMQVDAASVYGQMIEYFTQNGALPADPPAARTEQRKEHRLEAALAFKPGSTELLPAYSGNQMELERLRRELRELTANEGSLQQVRITGYAAPDGSTARNEELAVGRALRFRRYLSRQMGIPEQKIVVEQCSEDWDGLKRLTAEMHKPYAPEVASVLARTADPDARRKTLKALDGGKAWRDMEKTLFARLRRMQLAVAYETTEMVPAANSTETAPDVSQLAMTFNERPEGMTLNELLSLVKVYRPGTEQYREVYELAAYRFPDCVPAQLNAGASALEAGDTEEARFFLERVQNEPRAWINIGVLCLMENNPSEALDWFRKAMPVCPAKARKNMEVVKQMGQVGGREVLY